MIHVKKGTGSLCTRVEANDSFILTIDRMAGGKEIRFFETAPEKNYSGIIESEDEIWDDSFDRHITGNLTVPEGSELIIEAGTRVFLDGKVNLLQKDIRTRIVEHLSLQPTVDVTACLVLMSVVKDAERLGDYAKNLYEITEFADKPLGGTQYVQYFDRLQEDIGALFQQTKEAFIRADEDKARSAWEYEKTIAKKCDNIVEQLAHSRLSVNQAVCFTLVARHFKRIVAHLVNIATSVVLPLSELDYFDERRANE